MESFRVLLLPPSSDHRSLALGAATGTLLCWGSRLGHRRDTHNTYDTILHNPIRPYLEWFLHKTPGGAVCGPVSRSG